MQELNTDMADNDFFQKDLCAAIELSAATQRLIEVEQGGFDENRRRIEMLRRNRMVFEDPLQ